MTISEVALLLEGLKNATEQRDPNANFAPLMKKTKDYVDKFRTAKSAAMVQSMRECVERMAPLPSVAFLKEKEFSKSVNPDCRDQDSICIGNSFQ